MVMDAITQVITGQRQAEFFPCFAQGAILWGFIWVPRTTGKIPAPRKRDRIKVIAHEDQQFIPDEQRYLGPCKSGLCIAIRHRSFPLYVIYACLLSRLPDHI